MQRPPVGTQSELVEDGLKANRDCFTEQIPSLQTQDSLQLFILYPAIIKAVNGFVKTTDS